MKVSIKQTEDINFKATTANGSFDVIPKEISPTEYFAVGMISCSGTDIVSLPKAQGYEVSEVSIDADITRAENNPKIFESIYLKYSFNSNGTDELAKRWVLSSIETYCSTLNTVRNVSRITYGLVHNGNEVVKIGEISSGSIMGDGLDDFGVCCN